MNGFQHLPEYSAAERSYRLERTVVDRGPRPTPGRRRAALRRLLAALPPARRLPAVR